MTRVVTKRAIVWWRGLLVVAVAAALAVVATTATTAHAQPVVLYSLAKGISGEATGSVFVFTLPSGPVVLVASGPYNLAYPPGVSAVGINGATVTQVSASSSGNMVEYYAINNTVYKDATNYPYGLIVNGSIATTFPNGVSLPAASYAVLGVTVINLTTPYSGTTYFRCDVWTSSSATAYGVYLITNGTWTYVTFYSGTTPNNSWYAPWVTGPSGYFTPGIYLYECSVYTTSNVITGVEAGGMINPSGSLIGAEYAGSISSVTNGSTVYLTWSASSPLQFNYVGEVVPYVVGPAQPSTYPTITVENASVSTTIATVRIPASVISNINDFTFTLTSSTFSPAPGSTDVYLSTTAPFGVYYVPVSTYPGISVFAKAFYPASPPTTYAGLYLYFPGSITYPVSVSLNGTTVATVSEDTVVLAFGNTGDTETFTVQSQITGYHNTLTLTVPQTLNLYLPAVTATDATTLVCAPTSNSTYALGYAITAINRTYTFMLGVNASTLLPNLINMPPVAYVPVASLVLAVFAVLVLALASGRIARLFAIAVAVLALVMNLAFSTPMVTTNVHCLVTTTGNYATVTVSTPNPYYALAHVASIASALALLMGAALEAWRYLEEGW